MTPPTFVQDGEIDLLNLIETSPGQIEQFLKTAAVDLKPSSRGFLTGFLYARYLSQLQS